MNINFGKKKVMIPFEVACPVCRAGRIWLTTPGSYCWACENEGIAPVPWDPYEQVIDTAFKDRVWVKNYCKNDDGMFYLGL